MGIIYVLIIIVVILLSIIILGLRLLYKQKIVKKCTCTVSMLGKVIIITGANTGIGYYTALNLAARGGRIILACRNESKGLAARDRIITATANSNVIYKHLDLTSLASVRMFANDIVTTEERLDVLINNAGSFGPSDKYSNDGIIEGFQVNYFGPFLLTLLLLDLLKKSQPSRIINLSSILHYYGYINVANINNIGKSKLFTYVNSKLCSVLFCVEFTKRFQGTGVVANSIHPGVIDTSIARNANIFIKWAFKICCWTCYRTVEEGIHTVVHVAVSKECEKISGKFFMDCRPRFLLPIARNPVIASNLWNLSEKLVDYKLNMN